MIQRTPLPAAGNGIGVGADFVWAQALQVFAFAIENTHVRSKKLVGGAGQEIAIQSTDVNGPVRCVVDRVDVGEGSFLMSQLDDFSYIVDGAHGVGGVTDGQDSGPASDFFREVGEIESAVVFIDLGETDGHTALLERTPGRDVGVVVKVSEQNLVAGAEVTADGATHGEGQRGHVGPEDDLILVATEEIRHGGAGFGENSVGAATGGIGAASVGIRLRQVIGNGVDDALRYLSAARAIKENGGLAV